MIIFKNYLLDLQTRICHALQAKETEPFITDSWQYEPPTKANQVGGEGQSCILRNGTVFESAGVNFSHVKGNELPNSATLMRPELKNRSFEAMGLSLVIHPQNPFVPTTHANFRLLVAGDVWWFGGGYDLTPYYGFIDDAAHWHQTAYDACKPYGEEVYHTYKKNCDDYFYLKHRQEARGVGGLFFDDFNTDTFENCFEQVKSMANSFLPAYMPLVEKRQHSLFTQKQKQFQLMRRGRYVEFNLIYDRGTLFGLQSGGRIESILMSLPPTVAWEYNWRAEPGSDEEKLTDFFLKPQDWLNLKSVV